MNEQDIERAYKELAEAKRDYEMKDIAYVDTKEEYDSIFAKVIATGGVVGKNDTERKGAFEEANPDRVAKLRTAGRAASVARLRYDLAKIEVDRVLALLRLQEVLAAVKEK